MRLSFAFFVISAMLPHISDGAVLKRRLTGEDMDTASRWHVAGTDLGIPYILENGAIGYLFGDTFSTARPEDHNDWRSPVILRSAIHPAEPNGVVFDSAAGVLGDGRAPEIMHNGHNGDDGSPSNTVEVSVIPNDGISFPETGGQILSYMSIRRWNEPGEPWETNYAGLAVSNDGNTFSRVYTANWPNDPGNTSPYQMWTMQRDGDYVFVFSVRAGRQHGPMMLQRVRWDSMLNPAAYEGWGWDGSNWAWGREPTPILEGHFSEPSVRRLKDGTWVMVYLNLNPAVNAIVSRTASGPDQTWSEEKLQATGENLYGGFIHPWSTSTVNDLHLTVSQWTRDEWGATTAYHVTQYVGTV